MALQLEEEWAVWYDHFTPGRTGVNYDKGLFTLCSLHTVEDFWGCYNNLPAIASLDNKCGIHFMIKGIKPAWEDPVNNCGGILRLKVKKNEAQTFWKEMLMAIIGDSYKDIIGAEFNGISAVKKQGQFVFQLWSSRDYDIEEAKRYFLKISPGIKLIGDSKYQTCKNLLKFYA